MMGMKREIEETMWPLDERITGPIAIGCKGAG
jgi:hypothetical protein